jgi:hypothetical protein
MRRDARVWLSPSDFLFFGFVKIQHPMEPKDFRAAKILSPSKKMQAAYFLRLHGF